MKAHRTDVVSFAFGLIFVGLSAWWLLAQLLQLALPPVGWFLAGALILIGLLGLVGALRSGRSANREEPPGAPAAAGPDAGTGPAEVDRTAWDLPATADPSTADAQGWATGRSEWEVSAPMSGAPIAGPGGTGRDEADEWPTEAVTDRPRDGVEDRPADEDRRVGADRPGEEDRPTAADGRPERPAGAPVTGPPAGEESSRG